MPLNLTDLKPNKGANRDRTRVGRGHGSGKGKTAGRGTKGQNARAGGGVRIGFEGGQLPIQKRMPYKRGFTNIYRTPWEVVNLGALEALEVDGPITPELLAEYGLIRGTQFPVKILATGDLSRSVEVHAHAFSGSAKERIEAQGGSATIVERTDRWVTARPRSRRIPINRDLKRARLGKRGGLEQRSDLSDA
jgi:large subunit ribosomal protein L15